MLSDASMRQPDVGGTTVQLQYRLQRIFFFVLPIAFAQPRPDSGKTPSNCILFVPIWSTGGSKTPRLALEWPI